MELSSAPSFHIARKRDVLLEQAIARTILESRRNDNCISWTPSERPFQKLVNEPLPENKTERPREVKQSGDADSFEDRTVQWLRQVELTEEFYTSQSVTTDYHSEMSENIPALPREKLLKDSCVSAIVGGLQDAQYQQGRAEEITQTINSISDSTLRANSEGVQNKQFTSQCNITDRDKPQIKRTQNIQSQKHFKASRLHLKPYPSVIVYTPQVNTKIVRRVSTRTSTKFSLSQVAQNTTKPQKRGSEYCESHSEGSINESKATSKLIDEEKSKSEGVNSKQDQSNADKVGDVERQASSTFETRNGGRLTSQEFENTFLYRSKAEKERDLRKISPQRSRHAINYASLSQKSANGMTLVKESEKQRCNSGSNTVQNVNMSQNKNYQRTDSGRINPHFTFGKRACMMSPPMENRSGSCCALNAQSLPFGPRHAYRRLKPSDFNCHLLAPHVPREEFTQCVDPPKKGCFAIKPPSYQPFGYNTTPQNIPFKPVGFEQSSHGNAQVAHQSIGHPAAQQHLAGHQCGIFQQAACPGDRYPPGHVPMCVPKAVANNTCAQYHFLFKPNAFDSSRCGSRSGSGRSSTPHSSSPISTNELEEDWSNQDEDDDSDYETEDSDSEEYDDSEEESDDDE